MFCGPSGGVLKRPALLPARLHSPLASHFNSSRYHLVLFMLTCPSVFCAVSENRFNPDWDNFILHFVGFVGEGAI